MKTRVFLLLFALLACFGQTVNAQRATDPLDRGLVGVPGGGGIYLSWRVQADEYYDVTYNVYRNGGLIATNVTTSNYTDAGGNTGNTYTVAAVKRGVVQAQCAGVKPWDKQWLEIPMSNVQSRYNNMTVWKHGSGPVVDQGNYVINDVSLGDCDGDGKVDFIVKRKNQWDQDNLFPTNNYYYYAQIECYASSINYGRLWWIDCGPNICYGADEQWDAVAFDWNRDGACEVLYRGGANTIIHHNDGSTETIGNTGENIRGGISHTANMTFTNAGEEWLMYIDGRTGRTYDVISYPLPRGNASDWGDGYGHRSSKYFMGAPYMDGTNPFIFLGRGIYTKIDACLYRVNGNNKLYKVGNTWHSYNNAGWHGQGNHNFSIADADLDGSDEIIYGSMVLDYHTADQSLHGCSSLGRGHGDASHTGDLDPYRKGLETFQCHEEQPGFSFRNAATCEVYARNSAGGDDGRAMACNVSNDYPGSFGASTSSGVVPLSYVQPNVNNPTYINGMTNDWNGQTPYPMALNFRIYWDGDLLSETINGPGSNESYLFIDKLGRRIFDTNTPQWSTACINWTKKNPCASGDILGDWREELVMRSSDNMFLRVYTTNTPTEHRLPSLWYDHQYRQHIVWQTEGYNQPPHPSFFVGELEGLTQAPPPSTWTGRTGIGNNGSITTGHNNRDVLIWPDGNGSEYTVNINANAQPFTVYLNSRTTVEGGDQVAYRETKRTYDRIRLTGNALSGQTNVCKQGASAAHMPYQNHTHSGKTDVWCGALICPGGMPYSPIYAYLHTELFLGNARNATASAYKSLKMEYGSQLFICNHGIATPLINDNGYGHMTLGDLDIKEGSRIVFDIAAGDNDNTQSDRLNITGNVKITKRNWQYGPPYSAPVFQFNYAQGAIPAGDYELGSFGQLEGGSLKDIVVETPGGKNGSVAQIYAKDGKWFLHIGNSQVADLSGDPLGLEGKTYYLYNELQDKFLSRNADNAFVDNYGVPITFYSNGGTYAMEQADIRLYYSGMYWTSATAVQAQATWYKIQAVAGQDNTYTFRNTTNPADDACMYINMSEKYRVANNSSAVNTPDLRNSYWKLLTTGERNKIIQNREQGAAMNAANQAGMGVGQFSNLAELPVMEDCTGNIPDRTFGLTAVNNVYEVYQGDDNNTSYTRKVDLTQTATGLAKGLYRVTLPAHMRQGTFEICNKLANYNLSNAYIQLGDNTTQIQPWSNASTGESNPDSRAEAEAKYNAGNYKNEVYAYVPNDNGNLTIKLQCPVTNARGWFAFGAIKLERLGKSEDPMRINDQIFYIYNEEQDQFLSRRGTEACVDNFGLPIKFESNGPTYALKQCDTDQYYGGQYWTDVNATAETASQYSIDEVAGKTGVYYLKNMTNTAGTGHMYVNVTNNNRVANNSDDENTPNKANSEWRLVTAAERNAIIAARDLKAAQAGATQANLAVGSFEELSRLNAKADATSAIADPTFGLVAENNVYEVYQNTANLTQTASGLDKGLYKLTIPALYRQGSNELCQSMADQSMSLAYIQVGDQKIQIADWASDATNGNNPNSRAEADAKFQDGKYTNEVYFYIPDNNGSIDITIATPVNVAFGWLAFGEIKLEKLATPSDEAILLKALIDQAQQMADEYESKVSDDPFALPISARNNLIKEIEKATELYLTGDVTLAEYNAEKAALEAVMDALEHATPNPIDPYQHYYMILADNNGNSTNLYMDMSNDGAYNTVLSATPFEVRIVQTGDNISILNAANGNVFAEYGGNNSSWGTGLESDISIANSQYWAVERQDDGTIRLLNQNPSFKNWGWHLGGLQAQANSHVTPYEWKTSPVATNWILKAAPRLRGDVDVDYDVDMDDLVLLRSILFGKEPTRMSSDVDEDGRTSVRDLPELINILLEQIGIKH